MITTYDNFITNYLVEDGMLANALNINKAPDQLKKEILEVLDNISNLTNSKQTLALNGAFTASGKVLTVKKGDGSLEDVVFNEFDTKVSKIPSVNNRIALFSGPDGDIKLSTATIDESGNLVIAGAITSNTGVFNGNSTSSSKLATPRNIGGVPFDGTAAISLPGVNIAGNQNTTGNAATATNAQTSTFYTNGSGSENAIGVNLTGYNPVHLYSNSNTWGVYSTSGGAAFTYTRATGLFNFNGNANTSTTTTGNAGSATKLATPRTITLAGALSGSASFDGSANISITAAHTSDPTITLTGGVTGSATMYDLGNVSITTVIANDSHTHDSRYYTESESDSRFINSTGDIMYGEFTPGYNVTYDLGRTDLRWRTIYGTASAALYADLAEKYITDIDYEVGTVLQINTDSSSEMSLYNGGTLAGVISDKPGFILNDGSSGQIVALKGKTPVKCTGDIFKGQYCVAINGGTVIGVNSEELTFKDSLKLVGVALENSKNGLVVVKV